MPRTLLHCEVLQPCFITGSVLSFNASTQEVLRVPMTDRRVDPGQLVEIAEDHPIESKHVGQWMRVVRRVEVPDGGPEEAAPESDAERLSRTAATPRGKRNK